MADKVETTVFVVDDDEAVRDSLAAVLEAEGFAVETYGSGPDFLDAVDVRRRGCLLVDVHMPGMTGLELHKTLADRGATLPVVVITGYGDVTTAVKAMKAGALDFIEKPVEPQQLVDTVRRILAVQRKAARADTAVADIAGRLERLTPRERDVLEHLVAGAQNKVIAHELGISPRTVEIHRARVMEKMEARHLSELVRMALAAGVLDSRT